MNIKEIRKRLKLSQQEFANICGLSRVYISNLENGKIKNPGVNTLDQIRKSIENYIFFTKDVKYSVQDIRVNTG